MTFLFFYDITNNITIRGGNLKATSTADCGIYAKGSISFEDNVEIIAQGAAGALGSYTNEITYTTQSGTFMEAKSGTSEGNASFIESSPFSGVLDLGYLSLGDEYFATVAHEHDFSRQEIDDQYLAYEASCTEGAAYYYSCACGESDTQVFTVGEALSHDYGDWTVVKPATCTEAGSREKVCSVCGDKITEVIPATPEEESPNTGDGMLLWAVLLCVSGVGLFGTAIDRKKKSVK